MAYLHYGSVVRLQLDKATAKRATETIGAHATRGGWVTLADVEGRQWSLLISAGIPIWMSTEE